MSFLKLIVFIICLLILGCSPKSGSKYNTSGDEDLNTAESKTILSILSTTIVEDTEKELEQKLADEFMVLHPDVEVRFIGVPINHAPTQISTMAINDDLPDIFVNLPEFRNTLYELDITVDLSSYINPVLFDSIDPVLKIEAKVDDEIVFLPWSVVPIAVIYRTDWFEAKALEIPVNWDEFLETAIALTEDLDGDGSVDRWGFAMVGAKNSSGAVRFTNVLRSFGAYELRFENGDWITEIDSLEGSQALKYYGELYTKHRVVPPGPIEVSYEEAVQLMTEGKTAMMITGSHTIAAIIGKAPELSGKLGSFLVPKGRQHTSTLGIHGYSISKSSPEKKVAAEFLAFLLEKENQIRWFEKTGRMPVTSAVGEELLGRYELYNGFYQAFNYAVPYPRVSYYADMPDILGQAYQSVLTESATPQEAVKQAAKRIRQSINNP